MKITDVTLTMFKWEGLPSALPKKHSVQPSSTSQIALLKISTDAGVDGHAFLGTSNRSAEMDALSLMTYLKPVVIGQDPLAREKLHETMILLQNNTTMRAIGAGRRCACGTSAERLLGCRFTKCSVRIARASLRTSVRRAWQPSRTMPPKPPTMKAAGWAAYKIHPPAEDIYEDIEVCKAVREAVGDDYQVMLDSIWAYDYPGALRVGQAIQELGFHWYEDPLAGDDIFNYVKLRQQLHIPLMATEHSPGGFTAYAPWLVHQATDYLRGDVAVKGGITAVMKTAHLAEAFHVNYEIHHGGNSLMNVANLHCAMAIKNTEMFEVLLPTELQKYGLVEDIEHDENGFVHAITEPGLGAKIDFDLIESNKVAVLE